VSRGLNKSNGSFVTYKVIWKLKKPNKEYKLDMLVEKTLTKKHPSHHKYQRL
jgi:hypothetical protein